MIDEYVKKTRLRLVFVEEGPEGASEQGMQRLYEEMDRLIDSGKDGEDFLKWEQEVGRRLKEGYSK